MEIKTLAELELDCTDGFRNPIITDASFIELRNRSKGKYDIEMLTCPIYDSSDVDEIEE